LISISTALFYNGDEETRKTSWSSKSRYISIQVDRAQLREVVFRQIYEVVSLLKLVARCVILMSIIVYIIYPLVERPGCFIVEIGMKGLDKRNGWTPLPWFYFKVVWVCITLSGDKEHQSLGGTVQYLAYVRVYRGTDKPSTALAGSPHPGVIIALEPMYISRYNKLSSPHGHQEVVILWKFSFSLLICRHLKI
jgi:hypothetical protein